MCHSMGGEGSIQVLSCGDICVLLAGNSSLLAGGVLAGCSSEMSLPVAHGSSEKPAKEQPEVHQNRLALTARLTG